MYNYTYDKETGGLLLDTTPMPFSKEPRPVYYKELDVLGLDKHWSYDKQSDLPYMWAEANKYYYFGNLVAQTRGGDLYTAPEITIVEKLSAPLKPIDINAMLEKNSDFLQIIEQEAVKMIYDVWERYKSKVDIFHVAFSGGKDSIVLLDLVKKALPKDEFVVVFGDTQMEFPDTYDVIDYIEKECGTEGIRFYRAKSHMDALDSWKQFAPPSRVLRWCCSVHKSTPQVLKLREVFNKNNYSGLAFVGVRGAESARRNEYDFEGDGMKQKGQRSANPILDWSSAEVWLHIYKNNLLINETYKKGNVRAGCLLCPMSPGKADFFRYENYKREIENYIDIIMDTGTRKKISRKECMTNGTWVARNNGLNIKTNKQYKERVENDNLIIEVQKPTTDWREWIKTIGELHVLEDDYILDIKEGKLVFNIDEIINGYRVILPTKYIKQNPTIGKYFRQVFRKAAYCNSCKTCEANCKYGCITFKNGLKITDCIKCRACHEVPVGCLVYHSLQMPKGDGKMKSINTFGTHAPKTEWLIDFFERKNEFLLDNALGPAQKPFFRRFLRDAELISEVGVLPLVDKLHSIGWDTVISLGIILANVAYNPQFEWYIKNIDIGSSHARKDLENIMVSNGITERNAKSVLGDFRRIVQTPFGTILNFGYVDSKNNFSRNKCYIDSPLVVLYSLYKFAEACGEFYEFTVARLANFAIDSDGISPMQIFGIEEDEMRTIVRGLSATNSEFITAKFTHDLDTILLNKDKTSSDVLELL